MFGQRSSFKSFAFTFLGGVVAGVAVGLLYAPYAGKKMQKKVADVTEKVIDKVDDIQQSVRKLATA